MSRSEVSCELVAQPWYQACTSYRNPYGKPSSARRWDCGLSDEKAITCPTSWSATRDYLGSPSWWKESRDWFKFVKANLQFTDISDETLQLGEDLLKALAANGTLPS